MARVSQRAAVQRIKQGRSVSVELPLVGRIHLPPPEQLAFYGVVGALAVAEVIDWPIALLVATGHALMHNEHSQVAQEIGEALEGA